MIIPVTLTGICLPVNCGCRSACGLTLRPPGRRGAFPGTCRRNSGRQRGGGLLNSADVLPISAQSGMILQQSDSDLGALCLLRTRVSGNPRFPSLSTTFTALPLNEPPPVEIVRRFDGNHCCGRRGSNVRSHGVKFARRTLHRHLNFHAPRQASACHDHTDFFEWQLVADHLSHISTNYPEHFQRVGNIVVK